jgi:hypothetical protein
MVRVGPQHHRGENIALFVGYCIKNCQYTEMSTIYLIFNNLVLFFCAPQVTVHVVPSHIRVVVTNVQVK